MPNILDMPYSIVDLETTGANPGRDRITEVGLLRSEGDDSPETWEQLINPGAGIPEFIVQLTGITPDMVADQPFFDEISDALYRRLESTLFIAHNARFDYGFLKTAFKACGLNFQPKIICTVKLARKLFPEWRSHSLDNICREIGYPRDVSHRAMADVQAVYVFLCYAVAHKGEEVVNRACKAQLKQPSIPKYLDRELIDSLPDTPGVYYFYGDDKQLLYVGKSTTIKARVKSHFSADVRSQKEMKLSQSVRDIQYKETVGDLSAQLLENIEIKTLSPVYNQRQRSYDSLWFIELDENDKGFLAPSVQTLPVQDWSHNKPLYGPYKTKSNAKKALSNFIDEHQLCRVSLGLEDEKPTCFARQINQCRGACEGKEVPAVHNLRLQTALEGKRLQSWPYEGAIAIKEEGDNRQCCTHIVDQWCVLGVLSEGEDYFDVERAERVFDIDAYRILVRAMKSGRYVITPLSVF